MGPASHPNKRFPAGAARPRDRRSVANGYRCGWGACCCCAGAAGNLQRPHRGHVNRQRRWLGLPRIVGDARLRALLQVREGPLLRADEHPRPGIDLERHGAPVVALQDDARRRRLGDAPRGEAEALRLLGRELRLDRCLLRLGALVAHGALELLDARLVPGGVARGSGRRARRPTIGADPGRVHPPGRHALASRGVHEGSRRNVHRAARRSRDVPKLVPPAAKRPAPSGPSAEALGGLPASVREAT